MLRAACLAAVVASASAFAPAQGFLPKTLSAREFEYNVSILTTLKCMACVVISLSV